MRNKTIWGLGVLVILLVGATVFVSVRNRAEIQEREAALKAAQEELRQRTAPSQVPDESVHLHADGTFHEGEHDDPIANKPPDPLVQHTAPKGAVLKPDFPKVDPKDDPVKAAYARLEYIKNNPYAWGGVHSPRATELIDQLLPATLAADHNEGDERDLLIYELCEQNDPRAAEALIALLCDGGIGWGVMDDALVEIGPPAVPYILPYLEREDTKGSDWISIDYEVFDSLTRIGTRYRDDLGGIVDHIIIPKLEEIAADKDGERYYHTVVSDARETLDLLQ